jgi:hypothetical protein
VAVMMLLRLAELGAAGTWQHENQSAVGLDQREQNLEVLAEALP